MADPFFVIIVIWEVRSWMLKYVVLPVEAMVIAPI